MTKSLNKKLVGSREVREGQKQRGTLGKANHLVWKMGKPPAPDAMEGICKKKNRASAGPTSQS